MSASSSAAPASVVAAARHKICFNSQCKEPTKSELPPRRKGWRLRSGDHAELCDRCSCLYEQGNFCETFHAEALGWRKCELCGKRLHCGCIVSVPGYVLLDAGGVECITCARKNLSVENSRPQRESLTPFQKQRKRAYDHQRYMNKKSLQRHEKSLQRHDILSSGNAAMLNNTINDTMSNSHSKTDTQPQLNEDSTSYASADSTRKRCKHSLYRRKTSDLPITIDAPTRAKLQGGQRGCSLS